MLSTRPDGAYLVRFSSSSPGFFTVSWVSRKKIYHQRITHQPCSSAYIIADRTYASLSALIKGEKKPPRVPGHQARKVGDTSSVQQLAEQKSDGGARSVGWTDDTQSPRGLVAHKVRRDGEGLHMLGKHS